MARLHEALTHKGQRTEELVNISQRRGNGARHTMCQQGYQQGLAGLMGLRDTGKYRVLCLSHKCGMTAMADDEYMLFGAGYSCMSIRLFQ